MFDENLLSTRLKRNVKEARATFLRGALSTLKRYYRIRYDFAVILYVLNGKAGEVLKATRFSLSRKFCRESKGGYLCQAARFSAMHLACAGSTSRKYTLETIKC